MERYLIGLGTSPSRGHDCTCMLRRSDALHARPRALLEPLQGPREHLATRAFTCVAMRAASAQRLSAGPHIPSCIIFLL